MSTRRALTRTLLEGTDGALVRRTVLPSGLRIITEYVPGVRSVSFGVWVGVGSRDETPAQTGAAHFLEHLLFKGTETRTAWEISSAVEAVGGEMNAFTTKEYTCYYARVLDSDTRIAIDVVCDLVNHGLLAAEDIESERAVILEEIAMNDDDAADAVHDVFMRGLYGASPLGRPILGTQESLEGLSPRGIRGFYRRHYVPSQMVVAAAGSVDHEEVVAMVREAFGAHACVAAPARLPARSAARGPALRGLGSSSVVERSLEQANIVLGMPTFRRTDDRRYALGVLNAALGGGMSSRLFQRVREERGLAYSVYSFVSGFADTGFLGVYAGCLPERAREVVALCREVLDDVRRDGLGDEELARAKGQVRGGLVLGQEDTGARMSRIAKGEMLFGEIPSVDDVLARVDAVTTEDVGALASEVLAAPVTHAAIGPFGGAVPGPGAL
ncbi:MAG: M16 family metallopeptidase [bacterium]